MLGVHFDIHALWLLRGGNCLTRSITKFLPNFTKEED